MNTLKNKIARPFLIIMIIIPLITIILFNIAMRFYVAKTARDELRKTVSATEILIRQQINDNITNNNRLPVLSSLASLLSSIKVSKILGNTEILLFSSSYELVFPLVVDDTFVSNQLVDRLSNMAPHVNKNTIYTFTLNRERFFALNFFFDKIPDGKVSYVIFVTSFNKALVFTRVLNTILILIMLIALLLCTFISFRVSRSISKPIITIGSYAKKIGSGSYDPVPVDKSSREIFELCNDMNDMSTRLNNFDKAQKSFLQNASHELRTPLMSIQGYAEGIVKDIFPDVKYAAKIICEESIRLKDLVEELLTLSRIENQSYKYELNELNLSNCILEYIQRIKGIAITYNKQILINIPDISIITEANDTLLSQAIINIMSNCIRYSSSAVTISVHTQNMEAIIKISDDGEGISDADLPHIFERFYKGKDGHFGLGLSIAKSAVEYMAGKIEAHNITKGAEFVITLKHKNISPLC